MYFKKMYSLRFIIVKDDVYVVKIFLKTFLMYTIYRQKAVEKKGPSIHLRYIRQCIFKRYLNNCCKWQLRRLTEKRENDCFDFVFCNRLLYVPYENIICFNISFTKMNYQKNSMFITTGF